MSNRSPQLLSIHLFFLCTLFAPLFATEYGSQLLESRTYLNHSSRSFFHLITQRKRKDDLGSYLQTAGFYEDTIYRELPSHGLTQLDTDTVTIGARSTDQVDSKHLIHRSTASGHPFTTFEIKPRKRAIGFHLDLWQELDFILEGLFLHAHLTGAQRDLFLTPSFVDSSTPTTSYISLKEFFEGKEQALAQGLKFGKLTSTNQEKYGIEFLGGEIGYAFVDKNNLRLSGFLSVRLPSGPTPAIEFLLSPRIGTRNLTLGGGLSGSITFAHDHQNRWRLHQLLHATYSFEGTEERIPLVKELPFGSYFQSQKNGTAAGTKVAPLINLLPTTIEVHPGISVENHISLSYEHRDFVIESGYRALYQEAEQNKFSTTLTDGTYAIVHDEIDPSNYDGSLGGSTAFNIDGTFPLTVAEASRKNQAYKKINSSDLIISLPTSLTHEYFVSLGSSHRPLHDKFEISGSIGASVSYTTPEELSTRTYRFWAKACYSF